ncbi:MAG: sulfatase [Pirellulales bacterium]
MSTIHCARTLCRLFALTIGWLFSAILIVANAAHATDSATPTTTNRPPNIVIIFIDDMGYADIGPFGATAYKTPHLDQMAKEGRVFTDFHSATAVCSASRAGLLTGCYPERVSILGALSAFAKTGINADETTLAELCKSRGYATAIYGKWHLGHHHKFLPLQHGFDEYFGLPYSNDMSPLQADMIKGITPEEAARKRKSPPLPLFENNQIVDSAVSPEKLAQLTTLYTEHAVSFIDRHKDQPFFLYVPHTMVHVPLAVSDKFKDKSGAGLFGDVVMELDWSVGQILDTVKRNGLDDNTLVVFTSDNGPWLNYGNHAGSAGPLREGKGTMWEGGYREPCIMRWPGKIPAGTKCDELASTIDMFPTIAKLIGAKVPSERKIDGQDIWPLMAGETVSALLKGGGEVHLPVESPHDVLYCYYDRQLRAVRDRRWKLVLPHEYRTLAGMPGGRDGNPVPYKQRKTGQALYDLKTDIGEQNDVAAEHPEVVARLEKAAEEARATLGDTLTKREGSEVRPAGTL